jgi:hypothetical protein
MYWTLDVFYVFVFYKIFFFSQVRCGCTVNMSYVDVVWFGFGRKVAAVRNHIILNYLIVLMLFILPRS